ncbi:MAG: HAD-IIIC family phosphatase [Anaerolineales bacterium]|nr:HAD-IIIC family phosphatase [Anaerolineales bacterium]
MATTKLDLPLQPVRARSIKCLVWDLDDTLWQGILLEDRQVSLRPGIAALIRALDERGILQSIASRNDAAQARAQLEAFGLAEYFLYPQINWNAKSASVRAIAQALNLGLDSLAFIDDQPFERDEVAAACPEVLCLDAAETASLLERPAFTPRLITEDTRRRRRMMLSSIARDQAEADFAGPPAAFLATLGMVLTIERAAESDLQRAEELTLRTNQLNTTGYTYDYAQLNALRQSPDHQLLIAGLDDKYGTYGRIGLALVECRPAVWTLKLLLMSCRVMSRGVGSLLLAYILRGAQAAGVRLRAEFIATDRNRPMLITYRLAGFREIAPEAGVALLEHELAFIPPDPPYVVVRTPAV